MDILEIESIFEYKTPSLAKLEKYGFKASNNGYIKAIPIMKRQFMMQVAVAADNDQNSGADEAAGACATASDTIASSCPVTFKVIETSLNEEYGLINVAEAQGGFVGEVREACEGVLVDMAAKCFDTETLKAEQTKRIIEYVRSRWNVAPEFLWEKYPDYAAIRRSDNQKWFAVILSADRSRLGMERHGNVEILDLKGQPDDVAALIDGQHFFPAYHMNKTHWFTVCLDGSVSDEEIFPLIDESYSRAK